MVDIREKTVTDNDRVAEIFALATADLRRVYRRTKDTTKSATVVEDAPVSLVAVEGETIIGVVEYCTGPDSLYVRGLAVHPQQRRRGVARSLIGAIEGVAARDGQTKITLSTIKQTGNQPIFERLGFTVINEAPAKGFEGVDGEQVTKVDMCRMLD